MKTKISEWSTTPSSNTDIDGINIAEGCAPSGINDAIRDLMAQVRSWQSGASGDPFNGPMNGTVGATTAYSGAFTTLSASSTVTLSGGTANGVAYLNGSKVLTSGSALTFDGANIIVNATTPAYFTGTSNLAQVSINRSPSTGAIFNASQSAAYLNIDGASGGSSFQFVVASAANTQPSEQMRLTSTGLGIGSSSPAYKVNAVVPSAADAFFADANNLAYSGYRIRAGVSGQQWAFRGGTSTMGLTDVTAGVDRVVVDLSGNLGLGVTPSAWATYKPLQIGSISFSGTGTDLEIASNAYYNSGWKYVATAGGATRYSQQESAYGTHAWYVAPSGTAGNAITFTQALTLDSSGNLLVGTTSQLYAAAGSRLNVDAGANGGATIKTSGGSAQASVYCFNSATTGDNAFVSFGTEATWTSRGSITYNRAGGLTVYNTTSDYRAKDIYGVITDSGSVIDSVPVYMGKMKGATQERPMFIAHETPDYAHTGEKDAVDEDGNPIYQQMDASALIPVMWAEIQSLRKRLADAGL